MRRILYTTLAGDATLASFVVGGWHTYGKVSTPLPATPFGIIRMVGELPDAETANSDKQVSSIMAEFYVYDARHKRDEEVVASYLNIDAALERIYTLMNRKYLAPSPHRYFDTVYDTTSPDLVDDAWECLYKYSRWICRVAR